MARAALQDRGATPRCFALGRIAITGAAQCGVDLQNRPLPSGFSMRDGTSKDARRCIDVSLE
jgi:hypothetical protein